MKQQNIYIAIADRFPASSMNVVPFSDHNMAAAHVIGRIRKYIEGKPWNPEHWTGYGKSGEHHIDSIDAIDLDLDDTILYNDHVETSAIFGIAVRNMDDPANAEFCAPESPAEPGESSVDTLARTLWDGMYDKDRTIEDDTDAAVDYIRAMFPEAEAFREEADCYYFDYDGGKYFIKPEYSIDASGKIYYGKIVVSDYDGKLEPVTIDRDTDDVKGTIEKFFKKAKSAGDSPDSPDSPGEPSLMERLDKLDAEIKKLNNEIWKIKKSIKK
jgi:hypothetical protein